MLKRVQHDTLYCHRIVILNLFQDLYDTYFKYTKKNITNTITFLPLHRNRIVQVVLHSSILEQDIMGLLHGLRVLP